MDSLLFFIIILFSIIVCMLIFTLIIYITYYNFRNSENINSVTINTDTNIRNSSNDTLVEKTINSAYTEFR